MSAREWVLQAPDGTMFTKAAVLELLQRDSRETVQWIGIQEACEILRMDVRELRRKAVRWERTANPEVRVAHKTDAPNSHWLFSLQDVLAFHAGAGTKSGESGESGLDVDEAIQRKLRSL